MRAINLLRCLFLTIIGLSLTAQAGDFRDPLDTPAVASPLATRGLLNGLAQAGQRLVAVGQRGHVVYSDDAGSAWIQAEVPVSSDLLAVSFPTPTLGWAVGHDGVILHSKDGGKRWIRQLDGRRLGQLLSAHYGELAKSGGLHGVANSEQFLAEIGRLAAQGAENSFLDVWFSDARNGYVVGTFNLVLRTRDGGQTWMPWLEHTDNPKRLHIYAIRGIGDAIYAAGEQGLLMKLDDSGERFAALRTPYKGSYFGILGTTRRLTAFGLRGSAYLSDDKGRTWRKAETGIQEGLTGGTALPNGRLVLVSQAGRVLVNDGRGDGFSPVAIERPSPASAIVAVDDRTVAITGLRGVRRQALSVKQ